jgi:hypothetical protein
LPRRLRRRIGKLLIEKVARFIGKQPFLILIELIIYAYRSSQRDEGKLNS